jgi:hypothetical protein
LADHKRDDADIVDFVESLNPRRRRPARRSPTRTRRTPSDAPPRRWTIPLIAIVGALFATGGGIALAASGTEPPEVDCTLLVPANPLSAQGLATPYELSGDGCKESDDGASAFVQATIVDPDTGAITVYNPLVTDQGTAVAAAPVVPKLPAGAVVGIWFGFNGDNLTLGDSGGSLKAGVCVNGLGDSIFGQYAYCNAPAFFTAANAAVAAGKVTVPPLGTATDGQPCPTTRDFGIVDQDQSDNVTTTYLFLPDGSTAQNTAANQAKLASKGAKVEANGSDNGLLDSFVAPALGCKSYLAPDLADAGNPVPALALNELQAAAFQASPVALIPTNDPMSLVDGKASVRKTNLYRAGVNMGPIDTATETPIAYCQNMLSIGIDRTVLDRPVTVKFASPDAGAANNLFTFLAERMSGSFDELNCGALMHIDDPVTVVTNADGVATDARFVRVPPPPPASPSASPTRARPSASASGAAPSGSAVPSTAPGTPTASGRPTTGLPTGGPTTGPTRAPTTAPAQPTGAPSRPQGPTTGPTLGAPVPPTTHAPTAGTQPKPAATTAAAPPPANRQPPPPAAKPPAGPAVVPAGNAANSAAADAGVVASDDPAVPMDSAAPAPSLTLGPMPLKAGTGGTGGKGSGGGSMPPARLAGTVLLSGGGVLTVGILIRGLINIRRRRTRFATEF